MNKRFSKWRYFVNCILSFFLVGLISTVYFDISSSPYVYGRLPTVDSSSSSRESNEFNAAGGSSGKNEHPCNGYAGMSNRPALGHRQPQRSLFASLAQEGGESGHMVDIFVWVYIVSLVISMSHKYIIYRMQGFHYFFLDYCYFHNALLVFFLLRLLVEVEWSSEPIISFSGLAPRSWKGVQFLLQNFSSFRPSNTPREMKWYNIGLPLDGIHYPVSVSILTCSYVTANLSHESLVPLFVIFVTLLAGSLGPILGAIPMWHNALAFHSFDRMSSCYLHLMPAVIQGMFLHCFFTSARRKIASVHAVHHFMPPASTLNGRNDSLPGFPPPGIGAFAKQTLNTTWRNPHLGLVAYNSHNPLHALCDDSFCLGLAQAVTYEHMLWLHFLMFCVWQVFYHIFYEVRRYQRKCKIQRKRHQKSRKHMRSVLRLIRPSEASEMEGQSPSTANTPESIHPNMFNRVTALTWMMEHPPGGRDGLPYRFVTCLGPGRLPTTILFELCQWVLHVFFFSVNYLFMYLSFYVTFSVWPLLVLICLYAAVCVYNAARLNAKL
ncbi:unnamed protein product [Phytomonas sp. EM1]|nr:unnamed protein product [Phytomonas sp. EM1]|eukprot:CCW64890.1 unnamed protein product [Phytomonas sp. isolate EM1]